MAEKRFGSTYGITVQRSVYVVKIFTKKKIQLLIGMSTLFQRDRHIQERSVSAFAECVCNGMFAGVSFYAPHTFQIGHLLKERENEVCLRFTGNTVNLYGDVKVPFGLDP